MTDKDRTGEIYKPSQTELEWLIQWRAENYALQVAYGNWYKAQIELAKKSAAFWDNLRKSLSLEMNDMITFDYMKEQYIITKPQPLPIENP